jgi:hypothetical protein
LCDGKNGIGIPIIIPVIIIRNQIWNIQNFK